MAVVGVSDIAAGACVTVTVACVDTVVPLAAGDAVTVTTAVPTPTLVTTPLLTVATFGADEVHANVAAATVPLLALRAVAVVVAVAPMAVRATDG